MHVVCIDSEADRLRNLVDRISMIVDIPKEGLYKSLFIEKTNKKKDKNKPNILLNFRLRSIEPRTFGSILGA